MNKKFELIKDFQCPGCMAGPDPESCPSFEMAHYESGFGCKRHHPGTIIYPIGYKVALGLPKGYNRYSSNGSVSSQIYIFEEPDMPDFNIFNVPVWKRYENGFTFVRMFQPRLCNTYVIIMEGNRMKDINCQESPDPNTID